MADMNAFGRAMVRGAAPYLEDKRAARRGQTALDQQLMFLQKQGELQLEMKRQQDLYQMQTILNALKGNPDAEKLALGSLYNIQPEYMKVQKPLTLAEQADINYRDRNLDLNKEELGLRREEQGYMGDYYRGQTKVELAQAGKEDPMLDRVIDWLAIARQGGGEKPVQVGVEGDYVQTGVDKNGEPILQYVEHPKYQLAQQPAEGFSDAMKWAGEKLGLKYPEQKDMLNQQVQQAVGQIDFGPFYRVGEMALKNDPAAVRTIQTIIAKAKTRDPQALAIYAELKRKGYLNRNTNAAAQQ